MIDIHSHILPEIDDGSKSVEESIEMLKMLKEQGVTHVIATPHFKMTDADVSIDGFIEKRKRSYDRLMAEITAKKLDLPKIYLGAEVLLTTCLLEAEDIEKLCIEDTDIMLIELPYYEWQSWTFRMLFDLCSSAQITPIIAHADRYVDFIPKQTYEELFALNYETQVNADFVEDKKAIKVLKKWLKSGQICYVGSDCHGVKYRPPKLDVYKKKIDKAAGKAFSGIVESSSYSLIRRIENQNG